MQEITVIEQLPFITDVHAAGGEIYSVGGAVRDGFLGKISKDLDVLITGIPVDMLTDILKKYGSVKMVGESFDIQKFKAFGCEEDIDIAVPRTERKIGKGHKGFEVTANPFLPIEDDLIRRDFTINAMAKDLNGNLIDPFNGLADLEKKLIRLVNPSAFSDDPLRMLRAIQFASRFGFTIESETFQAIKDNVKTIREISPERVVIELEKIVSKGNAQIGAKLLVESGLYALLFGGDLKEPYESFNYVTMFGEFIYLLCDRSPGSGRFFKDMYKGDTYTVKYMEALALADSHYKVIHKISETRLAIKLRMFNALKKDPRIQSSLILAAEDKAVLAQFGLLGKYPANLKELAVNGEDIIALGLEGTAIGEALQEALGAVLADRVVNTKEAILEFLTIKNTY